MSKFQIIVTAIFVICIIAGVTLFATYKSSGTASGLPSVTIWGTFPKSTVDALVEQINSTAPVQLSINYVEEPIANFDKDFINALARGQGPDVILIPQDMILRYEDKIVPIPYTVFSQRDFMNSYIPQAELYLSTSGVTAIPFTIDPLVMYWNRDTFTNAGIATPPSTWADFTKVTNLIDKKDVNSNIRQSAIALGQFANITHAREILSALLLQAGNPITMKNGTAVESTLGDGSFQGSAFTTPALNFFIQFSDPQSPQYSWNRALPDSKDFFLSGSLATYFGFASELSDIRAKNPNIDFDVAQFPQAQNVQNRITYGDMYGFSIVRTASNQTGTYTVLQQLTNPSALALLSKLTYLPPVDRNMIATGSTDPYLAIFDTSALISRGWLDTDATESNQIFQEMIESIESGKNDIHSAIQNAQGELDQSLQNP